MNQIYERKPDQVQKEMAGEAPPLWRLYDWPHGTPFQLVDMPGEHDPCWVIMPDRTMLPLNQHPSRNADGEFFDVARARFIVDACNRALLELQQGVVPEQTA